MDDYSLFQTLQTSCQALLPFKLSSSVSYPASLPREPHGKRGHKPQLILQDKLGIQVVYCLMGGNFSAPMEPGVALRLPVPHDGGPQVYQTAAHVHLPTRIPVGIGLRMVKSNKPQTKNHTHSQVVNPKGLRWTITRGGGVVSRVGNYPGTRVCTCPKSSHHFVGQVLGLVAVLQDARESAHPHVLPVLQVRFLPSVPFQRDLLSSPQSNQSQRYVHPPLSPPKDDLSH